MPGSHTVREGGCVSNIAFRFGFFPDTLARISHHESATSAQLPESAGRILARVLDAPQVRLRTRACGSTGTSGHLHTLATIRGEKCGPGEHPDNAELKAQREDPDVLLAGGIPPETCWVKIGYATGQEYSITLGRLDPVTEISGVQQRLANPGFYRGRVYSRLGEEASEVVQEFLASQGLEETGDLDDATRDVLVAENGSQPWR